jgi:hypothetical protein
MAHRPASFVWVARGDDEQATDLAFGVVADAALHLAGGEGQRDVHDGVAAQRPDQRLAHPLVAAHQAQDLIPGGGQRLDGEPSGHRGIEPGDDLVVPPLDPVGEQCCRAVGRAGQNGVVHSLPPR